MWKGLAKERMPGRCSPHIMSTVDFPFAAEVYPAGLRAHEHSVLQASKEHAQGVS